MAAAWTLLLCNPSGAQGGAAIAELSQATDRSLTFVTDGADQLSFAMPADHWQTRKIKVLQTDVLVFRGSERIQRFRIVGENVGKSGGRVECSYTAVSYRGLLDAWVVGEADQRHWGTQTNQQQIAWDAINQAQVKVAADWGIAQGVHTGANYTRIYPAGITNEGEQSRIPAGTRVGEFVTSLSNLRDPTAVDSGFDWDIEPTSDTALAFNTWTAERTEPAGASIFVLDDGGAMASWGRQSEPTGYGNVSFTKSVPPEGALVERAVQPTTGNPTLPAPEGRWELYEESDQWRSALTTQQAAYDRLLKGLDYLPTWTCALFPGRWPGRAGLWKGYRCRVLVSTSPLEVDEVKRIAQLTVTLSDVGTEQIGLSLGRPAASFARTLGDIQSRLAQLNRR